MEDQGVVFWVRDLFVITIVTTIIAARIGFVCGGCGIVCGRCPVRDCPEGFRRVGEGACWDLDFFWSLVLFLLLLLVFWGRLNVVVVVDGGVFCVEVCKGGEGEGSRDGDGDGDGECGACCEGWEEG